jgi:LacI family transcriptional regulator
MDEVARLKQPMIIFQEHLDVPYKDAAVVRQDDRTGGQLLAENVLASNVRSVFYLVPALPWPAVEEREAGIRKAFYRRDVAFRVVQCGKGDLADTQLWLSRAIDEFGVPNAVMAANDQMGISAMKLLQQRGLRIPTDVRITGFNAFEFCEYANPILTTIRSAAYQMGSMGADIMLERLQVGTFSLRQKVISVELQVGGST